MAQRRLTLDFTDIQFIRGALLALDTPIIVTKKDTELASEIANLLQYMLDSKAETYDITPTPL